MFCRRTDAPRHRWLSLLIALALIATGCSDEPTRPNDDTPDDPPKTETTPAEKSKPKRARKKKASKKWQVQIICASKVSFASQE